jgi:hypothetical protein
MLLAFLSGAGLTAVGLYIYRLIEKDEMQESEILRKLSYLIRGYFESEKITPLVDHRTFQRVLSDFAGKFVNASASSVKVVVKAFPPGEFGTLVAEIQKIRDSYKGQFNQMGIPSAGSGLIDDVVFLPDDFIKEADAADSIKKLFEAAFKTFK